MVLLSACDCSPSYNGILWLDLVVVENLDCLGYVSSFNLENNNKSN